MNIVFIIDSSLSDQAMSIQHLYIDLPLLSSSSTSILSFQINYIKLNLFISNVCLVSCVHHHRHRVRFSSLLFSSHLFPVMLFLFLLSLMSYHVMSSRLAVLCSCCVVVVVVVVIVSVSLHSYARTLADTYVRTYTHTHTHIHIHTCTYSLHAHAHSKSREWASQESGHKSRCRKERR